MTSAYGNLFIGNRLEEATEETLRLWLPAYIAEVERQEGLPAESMPMVRSYASVNEFIKFNEERLPALIVVSPGLSPTAPRKRGDGSYEAWYRVGAAVVAGGKNRETTRRNSQLYAAAIRGAILQHQTLGDFGATEIRWTGERNADVPDEMGRTLGSGGNTFDVLVPDVVNPRLGPLEPPEDPYEPQTWPPFSPGGVTVTPKEAT